MTLTMDESGTVSKEEHVGLVVLVTRDSIALVDFGACTVCRVPGPDAHPSWADMVQRRFTFVSQLQIGQRVLFVCSEKPGDYYLTSTLVAAERVTEFETMVEYFLAHAIEWDIDAVDDIAGTEASA